jgi:hypothetical protein
VLYLSKKVSGAVAALSQRAEQAGALAAAQHEATVARVVRAASRRRRVDA